MNSLPIHHHLAQTMSQRLTLLSQSPQHISIFKSDMGNSFTLLNQHYPKAQFTEYDHFHQQSDFPHKKKWWQLHKPSYQHQLLNTPLPIAKADLLWCNLGLLDSPSLIQTFEEWSNHLKRDGLLFFSHLGRNSLPEIRTILDKAQIPYETPLLLDMHDLGDMLFHHGFYDPVMDTSELVLDYQNFDTLWQDILDLNIPSLVSTPTQSLQHLLQNAWQQHQIHTLTLETVFGHALKKIQLPANESEVHFFKN